MKKEFTATVYILHEGKVLLLYHKKLQKWLPPGGHMEPNETPPEAARREVKEETGLEIQFLKQENIWVNHWNANSIERPYLCLLEEIPAYRDVPAHQHIDMIFVAQPVSSDLVMNDESHSLRWFSIEELKLLELDIEIFKETFQVIEHLFTQIESEILYNKK